ncbi:hypothetical protein OKA05_21270 [Luteolibacter arcticus]|uniref:Uncharacterized protein n=2 Tax=Luteolibacter arcticus TaxID=1581411 RepID=A0ABT3GNQ1_9BACT|nr:hypothetical protein [Luteolibacter arcticus]
MCRQQGPARQTSGLSYDLATLVVATGIFGYGLFSEQPAWMMAGFGLEIYRLVQWLRSSFRWAHVYNGIILKYDHAFREPSEPEVEKA